MSELRILCVDDEPRILEGIENNLGFDFDVTTAGSGKEGLRCLEYRGPYSVVISDMRMPEMNGAEFLAKVRERWPDTVRILLTGQADAEAIERAHQVAQVAEVFHKPWDIDELTTAIRRELEQP